MTPRGGLFTALAATLACAALAACPPPPKPPPPPPPPQEEPPPPPPPKCEALQEGCVAKSGLRAPIHPLEWTIEPPTGWKYAIEADGIVATSELASVAVSSFEAQVGKKPAVLKANNAKRLETVARLSEKLAIVRSKKLAFPPKPMKTSKVHNVDVALYQFDAAKHENDAGPLLVFIAQPKPERTLVGVAFVAEKDSSNADAAILKAIDSLAPGVEAAAAPPDAGAPDAR